MDIVQYWPVANRVLSDRPAKAAVHELAFAGPGHGGRTLLVWVGIQCHHAYNRPCHVVGDYAFLSASRSDESDRVNGFLASSFLCGSCPCATFDKADAQT